MKIELNIFTNCHKSSPDISIVKNTYDSFIKTFGEYPVKIYCDKHPNIHNLQTYKHNLSKITNNIIITESLSDVYIKSIENSDADYLFQLENDWEFNNNINHTLEDITAVMSELGIYHFRFNKRQNLLAGWDRELLESYFNGLQYCITNNLSNNPHIIDRKKYDSELKHYIKVVPGSKGIEHELNKHGHLKSIIYGTIGYEATITHTDGRH